MYSKLFHKDIFIPNGVNDICKECQKHLMDNYVFDDHFELHMDNQATEDRSHTYSRENIIKCLETLKNTQRDVFEVELSKDFYIFGDHKWHITKYCIRIPYSNKEDLCIVIWTPKHKRCDGKRNNIHTGWMNSNNDHHFTLDESKYTTETEWHSINRR